MSFSRYINKDEVLKRSCETREKIVVDYVLASLSDNIHRLLKLKQDMENYNEETIEFSHDTKVNKKLIPRKEINKVIRIARELKDTKRKFQKFVQQ